MNGPKYFYFMLNKGEVLIFSPNQTNLDKALKYITLLIKDPEVGETFTGKELTGFLLVAVAIGIVYHIVINRTRFGFDLRASGINPFAARSGGVKDKRMVLGAMVLSGMAAGLVGMAEVAKLGSYNPNFVSGLGFAGIGVALLGRNHPGGIAIGAIVFAFLDISSGVLQITGSASREIVYIMQGIILLAAVISYEIVQRYRLREEAKQAGDALSESVTS